MIREALRYDFGSRSIAMPNWYEIFYLQGSFYQGVQNKTLHIQAIEPEEMNMCWGLYVNHRG